MTTGTRNIDLRTVQTGSCGTGLAGSYSNKTWSGADQAPLPANPVQTYTKPLYRLVPYIDSKGRRKIRREFSGDSVTMKRFQKSPKRARHYDEHAYTCSGRVHRENPITYLDLGYPPGQQLRVGHPALCFGSLFSLPPTKWVSNNTLEAINKLRDKLLGDGDFDIGVFLVELPQAARMIAQAAYKLDRAIHFARRGNFLEAERVLIGGHRKVLSRSRKLDAARNWLELQYGWKPLLSDAYHGAQQLAHMAGEPFQNVVRVTRRIEEDRPPSPGVGVIPRSGEYFSRHSIKAVIKEVNVPKLTGLTNPETMAWEKIPFSFVVDWFIPIGTYLEARGVKSSVTGTFVRSHLRVQRCKGLVPTQSWMSMVDDGGFSDETYSFSRSVSSTLVDSLPTFKPLSKVASWAHAANAVALLLNHHGSADQNKWREAGFTS